jgi:competence protein ComGC
MKRPFGKPNDGGFINMLSLSISLLILAIVASVVAGKVSSVVMLKNANIDLEAVRMISNTANLYWLKNGQPPTISSLVSGGYLPSAGNGVCVSCPGGGTVTTPDGVSISLVAASPGAPFDYQLQLVVPASLSPMFGFLERSLPLSTAVSATTIDWSQPVPQGNFVMDQPPPNITQTVDQNGAPLIVQDIATGDTTPALSVNGFGAAQAAGTFENKTNSAYVGMAEGTNGPDSLGGDVGLYSQVNDASGSGYAGGFWDATGQSANILSIGTQGVYTQINPGPVSLYSYVNDPTGTGSAAIFKDQSSQSYIDLAEGASGPDAQFYGFSGTVGMASYLANQGSSAGGAAGLFVNAQSGSQVTLATGTNNASAAMVATIQDPSGTGVVGYFSDVNSGSYLSLLSGASNGGIGIATNAPVSVAVPGGSSLSQGSAALFSNSALGTAVSIAEGVRDSQGQPVGLSITGGDLLGSGNILIQGCLITASGGRYC